MKLAFNDLLYKHMEAINRINSTQNQLHKTSPTYVPRIMVSRSTVVVEEEIGLILLDPIRYCDRLSRGWSDNWQYMYLANECPLSFIIIPKESCTRPVLE